MRVIAGIAKGRRLKAPSGWNTRPITDMIKEALFNVLQQQVVNSDFLDLFAGSGSVGIEALSRGASRVVFVDASKEAVKVIHDNLKLCRLDGEVYRNDVFNAINLLIKHNRKFDIIYADPPFSQAALFERTLQALSDIQLLNSGGLAIIRVPSQTQLPPGLGRLQMIKRNIYGESSLYYYRPDEEEVPDDGDI